MSSPNHTRNPSTSKKKKGRIPLSSGNSLPVRTPRHPNSVGATSNHSVNPVRSSSYATPSTLSSSSTTTPESYISSLLDSMTGTPLEPGLRTAYEFVRQNRGTYDDLLRRQNNTMKRYIVEERESLEKICSDWTEEVGKDIKDFLQLEIASHSPSTTHDSSSGYQDNGLHQGFSSVPPTPNKIKVEYQEKYVSFDKQMSGRTNSTNPISGTDFSDPLLSHHSMLPEHKPPGLDERIQVRTANLLRTLQGKSKILKVVVSGKFSKFSISDSKEHTRLAYEQDRMFESLILESINHQVRSNFL